MQYAIYPFKTVRETQKVGGTYSHKGSFAWDEGGKDTAIDNIYAPCDLKVVKKGGSQVNFVYFQSIQPVKFADGSEDYINFRIGHDNDISNIYVGQTFKQFDVIGQEGKRGATGNHSHIQVAKGQFKGFLKNIYGVYMLVNEIHPIKVFSMLTGYNTVLKTSYTWNWVKQSTYTPPKVVQKVKAKYTGSSIVDYLKSIGFDSSFKNRRILATKYGIRNYIGTANQNKSLLEKLRGN